jgi:hypothetical protein
MPSPTKVARNIHWQGLYYEHRRKTRARRDQPVYLSGSRFSAVTWRRRAILSRTPNLSRFFVQALSSWSAGGDPERLRGGVLLVALGGRGQRIIRKTVGRGFEGRNHGMRTRWRTPPRPADNAW